MKKPRYFKFVSNVDDCGRLSPYEGFSYDRYLPKIDKKGKWTMVVKKPVLCARGWHAFELSDRVSVSDWYAPCYPWQGALELYEVELKGEIAKDEYGQVAAESMRFVRLAATFKTGKFLTSPSLLIVARRVNAYLKEHK